MPFNELCFFSVKTRIGRATFHSHLEYFGPICVPTLYYFGGSFMSQTIFESSDSRVNTNRYL